MASEKVFVVGAPRSGTTWLQKMLGAHPLIAAPQELHLVSAYLAPWQKTWRDHLPDSVEEWRSRRFNGLASALTESEFDDLLRDVAESVYGRVLALKPGATILLDKVPLNSLHGPLIARLFPTAHFVHVIRDGRDVVASLLRAARGWGSFWAPERVESAADQWRDHVEAARSLRQIAPHYTEVRYEELLSERGPRVLQHVFEFCGAEADEATVAAAFAATSLDGGGGSATSTLVWGGEALARAGTAPPEPDGFVGEGGVGAWRRDLDVAQRLLFEREAGRLLRELGYAGNGWTEAGPLRRAAAAVRLSLARQVDRARYHAAVWIRG